MLPVRSFFHRTSIALMAWFLLACNFCWAQLPFSDNFESGTLLTGAWSVNGSASISKQKPAGGSFCLKGSATWGINKKVSGAQANFIFIEFKSRASQSNTTSMVFRVIDSTGRTAGGVFFNHTGHIMAVDGVSSEIILTYDTGQWYSFKLVMDMGNKTYDLFIDQVLKADDFSFNSPFFSSVNTFTWSSIATSGEHWLDDISIYPALTSVNIPHQESYNIFPNPFRNSISLNLPEGESSEVEIFSLDGRLMRKAEISGQGFLDLSDLLGNFFYVKTRLLNTGEIRVTPILRQGL